MYNKFNIFFFKILFLTADAMVSSGLAAVGYQYINLGIIKIILTRNLIKIIF